MVEQISRVSRQQVVPGPTENPSGIAAKAIAVREGRSNGPVATSSTEREPPLYRVKPQLPSTPIGKLAAGIAGVMAEVGTIKKGGYNSFHQYHYARMEDLLEALTPLMGKHGVVVIQNEIERATIENRIAVTYEFSIIHASGEIWPEQPRFTGMTMGRDRKGNWDDKAINKCHTAARKYFLLSLFQVPAGDFDDGDPGGGATQAESQQQKARVPGPGNVQQAADKTVEEKFVTPQRIGLGQGAGPDQWASVYIETISKAKTSEEVLEWDRLNEKTLQSLADNHQAIYAKVEAAANQRLQQLAPKVQLPSDPQEAMNFIATQLAQMKTYEAAETFWNNVVAPLENTFDAVDWDMLMKEWQRTELRFKQDEPDEQQQEGTQDFA